MPPVLDSTYLSLFLFVTLAGRSAYANTTTESYTSGVESHSTQAIPDPRNVALMARFIVHTANWASISYISHAKETEGLPMMDLFSVSDGPKKEGSGLPYFYVTRLQDSISDMLKNSPVMSLMMSLAQTSICDERDFDPQDPRCAHVVLTGTFVKINSNSSEYEKAKNAIFSRHRKLIDLPVSHDFFFGKMNITHIVLQDMFGGPKVVNVDEYFKAGNSNRTIAEKDSGAIKNKVVFTVLVLGIINLFI